MKKFYPINLIKMTKIENKIASVQKALFTIKIPNLTPMSYSGIFYFCQYLHIGAGILSFGGDVFRL